ncbi:hypothetical protein CAPTEDRAFT_190588 [Capitella teleta]|uniref:Uncharacterized protein n=1 Tax=Capitella teleta TaxID=283909 RepID=R7UHS1_CAPTE|nr:hypothetical protein CAPTEDRAFT_190588 [Capitella teleta]|eukprot:ELU03353.1 hypothetical protein CAPTEDRAFT_190588 [Capitella teleta]
MDIKDQTSYDHRGRKNKNGTRMTKVRFNDRTIIKTNSREKPPRKKAQCVHNEMRSNIISEFEVNEIELQDHSTKYEEEMNRKLRGNNPTERCHMRSTDLQKTLVSAGQTTTWTKCKGKSNNKPEIDMGTWIKDQRRGPQNGELSHEVKYGDKENATKSTTTDAMSTFKIRKYDHCGNGQNKPKTIDSNHCKLQKTTDEIKMDIEQLNESYELNICPNEVHKDEVNANVDVSVRISSVCPGIRIHGTTDSKTWLKRIRGITRIAMAADSWRKRRKGVTGSGERNQTVCHLLSYTVPKENDEKDFHSNFATSRVQSDENAKETPYHDNKGKDAEVEHDAIGRHN